MLPQLSCQQNGVRPDGWMGGWMAEGWKCIMNQISAGFPVICITLDYYLHSSPNDHVMGRRDVCTRSRRRGRHSVYLYYSLDAETWEHVIEGNLIKNQEAICIPIRQYVKGEDELLWLRGIRILLGPRWVAYQVQVRFIPTSPEDQL